MLSLRGERCLVVGGGGVALRKVEGLLAEGARVTLIAPKPIAALERLAAEARITLERRAYEPGEAARFALVFAATDSRETNRQVYADARGAGIWVNVADDPGLCTFHLPSRLRRGALQLCVASAGEAPFVVRRMRQLLERRFGAEWGEWIEAAARFRRAVRRQRLSRAEEEDRFDAFFGATVDPQRLVARVPTASEEALLLSARPSPSYTPGAFPDSRAAEPAPARPAQQAGFVSLVGAGPGDPQLLTLRGRQRLLGADAVVCDRLALSALPCDLPARVRIHGVGKTAGHHPVPQEEIALLLVRLARDGKKVVRLKGGDPYVFGRGGEEALALAEAKIPFEVVPGVTAGISVPAYAGIPVTHRREVVRVTFVTAHEAIKSAGPQVRWDLIAADPHATLVGYMGVTALRSAVEQLLAAGMDPRTPAAMVEQGCTSAQRNVRASAAELADAVARAGLQAPALFVIGPTVRHAPVLDWFGSRPLRGRRVVMTCAPVALSEQLELAGAELVVVPIPLTPAAELVMGALPLTDCILQEPHEAEVLDEARDGLGWNPQVLTWALTARTAARARQLGWKGVHELEPPVAAERLVALMLERRAPTAE
jgi:uroporphyrin-III C-methyltransferase/precorrin-2 dehydrogenase/sirohydrochlorin ferrochelatase